MLLKGRFAFSYDDAAGSALGPGARRELGHHAAYLRTFHTSFSKKNPFNFKSTGFFQFYQIEQERCVEDVLHLVGESPIDEQLCFAKLDHAERLHAKIFQMLIHF